MLFCSCFLRVLVFGIFRLNQPFALVLPMINLALNRLAFLYRVPFQLNNQIRGGVCFLMLLKYLHFEFR